eukprot:evm.model.scf_449.2 EVM.evm.TU.scf_449.2   scf_449:7180-13202(+)
MEPPKKIARLTLASESGRIAVVEPERYEEQLDEKIASVNRLFSSFKLPRIEVFRSKPSHYRMRAEFRVWHDGEEVYYTVFQKDDSNDKRQRPKAVRIDSFPAGSELMNELMAALMQEVVKQEELRHKLHQVNFHTTLKGEAMVTMIYHKKLQDTWIKTAKEAAEILGKVASCSTGFVHIIGRSRKQKICLNQDFVVEELQVNNKRYLYRQVEGSFSQPNASVAQHMVAWSQTVTSPACDGQGGAPVQPTEDLIELYCGNANFTIPLSENFKTVVATEVSKASVAAARENIKANGVTNILLGRMSSEEFVEAWKQQRPMRRLPELQWTDLKLTTLLVDPPRAGLDKDTEKLLHEFDSIVYISCNPATLRDNLETVKETHDISRFAVFDQFPYTSHLECGAYLKRRACEHAPQEAKSPAGNPSSV